MKKQYRVLYSFDTMADAESYLQDKNNIGKVDLFIEDEQTYYYSISPYTQILKADNESDANNLHFSDYFDVSLIPFETNVSIIDNNGQIYFDNGQTLMVINFDLDNEDNGFSPEIDNGPLHDIIFKGPEHSYGTTYIKYPEDSNITHNGLPYIPIGQFGTISARRDGLIFFKGNNIGETFSVEQCFNKVFKLQFKSKKRVNFEIDYYTELPTSPHTDFSYIGTIEILGREELIVNVYPEEFSVPNPQFYKFSIDSDDVEYTAIFDIPWSDSSKYIKTLVPQTEGED